METNNPPNQPAHPILEAPSDLKSVYANLARIAHSPADIVMDFAHLLPGERQVSIQARILMSPISAKLFFNALGENLARYETAYGTINVPGNSALVEHLFRPLQTPPDNPASK
jgi:hypothetical protein